MKTEYAKDVILSFFLQLLENGRSFLLIPVIAKTIGASGFGVWIQVKIGIAFLCPFLLLGTGNGVLRFLPGSSKENIKDSMLSASVLALSTGAGLGLLVFLAEGFLQHYFESIPNSGFLIKAIVLLCIAEPLNSISLEYFRSFRLMNRLLAISVLDTIFETLPVFWFVYNGFGIGVVIFSYACARSFTTVIKVLLVFWRVGFGTLKTGPLKKFIRFGFPLIWSTLFFYITNYIDRFLIGYFYSTKEVGIYSLAYSIGYVAVLCSAPWGRVLIPTLNSFWNQGNLEEVNSYFNKTLKYIIISTIPVMVFISAAGQEVVKIISTAEFASVVIIIPVLMAAFFMHQLGVYHSKLVILAHNSTVILKVYALGAISSFILNILLIPKFSIYGASLALLATYTILYLLFYFLTLKQFDIEPYTYFTIKVFTATLPGLIILIYTDYSSIALSLLAVLFAALSYVGLLIISGIIDKKEWLFAKKIFQAL